MTYIVILGKLLSLPSVFTIYREKRLAMSWVLFVTWSPHESSLSAQTVLGWRWLVVVDSLCH